MHHSDDKMMTKKNNILLMKSLEVCPIEFAPFLEKNVVATYDNFEIAYSLAPFYRMNVVAVNS